MYLLMRPTRKSAKSRGPEDRRKPGAYCLPRHIPCFDALPCEGLPAPGSLIHYFHGEAAQKSSPYWRLWRLLGHALAHIGIGEILALFTFHPQFCVLKNP